MRPEDWHSAGPRTKYLRAGLRFAQPVGGPRLRARPYRVRLRRNRSTSLSGLILKEEEAIVGLDILEESLTQLRRKTLSKWQRQWPDSCVLPGFRRQWFAMRRWEARIACIERFLTGLDWAARRRGGGPGQPAHLATGIEGEDAAFFYLRRKGYIVVARRWSPGDQPGDIDLIAWQGPCLLYRGEDPNRSRRYALPRLRSTSTSAISFAGWRVITFANCRRKRRRRCDSTLSASIWCPAKKGIRPL